MEDAMNLPVSTSEVFSSESSSDDNLWEESNKANRNHGN